MLVAIKTIPSTLLRANVSSACISLRYLNLYNLELIRVHIFGIVLPILSIVSSIAYEFILGIMAPIRCVCLAL